MLSEDIDSMPAWVEQIFLCHFISLREGENSNIRRGQSPVKSINISFFVFLERFPYLDHIADTTFQKQKNQRSCQKQVLEVRVKHDRIFTGIPDGSTRPIRRTGGKNDQKG